MLVEKTRTTEVAGEVITDNFTYNVSYSLNGANLVKLTCNVDKKVVSEIDTPEGKQPVEEILNIGFISLDAGNKQVYIQEEEDTICHAKVFETVLSEVRAALVPVAPVAKSK